MSYPPALALTLAVEVPVYAAALTAASPVRSARAPGPRQAAVAALLVNLLTHPLLWWFLRGRSGVHGTVAFALAECAVCAVEGALVARLLRIGGPVPYTASVAANAASVLAGRLLLG